MKKAEKEELVEEVKSSVKRAMSCLEEVDEDQMEKDDGLRPINNEINEAYTALDSAFDNLKKFKAEDDEDEEEEED